MLIHGKDLGTSITFYLQGFFISCLTGVCNPQLVHNDSRTIAWDPGMFSVQAQTETCQEAQQISVLTEQIGQVWPSAHHAARSFLVGVHLKPALLESCFCAGEGQEEGHCCPEGFRYRGSTESQVAAAQAVHGKLLTEQQTHMQQSHQ